MRTYDAQSGPSSGPSISSSSSANKSANSYRHHHEPRHSQSTVFSSKILLNRIIDHLYSDLLVLGREKRQAELTRIATVNKIWKSSLHARLYRNPFLGTGDRAGRLEAALKASPWNADYVEKLIFGEGSSDDVRDWPTPSTPCNILRMSRNVICVGFDGLHNVSLEEFGFALASSKHLQELRACDKMPMPWCTIPYFCDNILQSLARIRRLRLYGLHTQLVPEHASSSITSSSNVQEVIQSGIAKATAMMPLPFRHFPPVPLMKHIDSPLTSVSLNHCAISGDQVLRIFSGSSESLTTLSLESHSELTILDLLALLNHVGKNLKVLEIDGILDTASEMKEGLNLEGVASQSGQNNVSVEEEGETAIDMILQYCPSLKTLDFLDGLASGVTPKRLGQQDTSTCLKNWRFTCNETVTPDDWINAFQSSSFPRNARCRVQVPEVWSRSDHNRVRVAAWRFAGLSWLSAEEDESLDSEDE